MKCKNIYIFDHLYINLWHNIKQFHADLELGLHCVHVYNLLKKMSMFRGSIRICTLVMQNFNINSP